MSNSYFDRIPFEPKESSFNSKSLGAVEVAGKRKEVYVPSTGIPDLYVEGVREPIIKLEIDFVPGEGWRATDLIENENPDFQAIINEITRSGEFKYYAEEVDSYIRLLNQTKPNGV